MRMKNKKGISHVEVVLSFVIFLGFLIFLISIFRPFKVTSGDNLDLLERGIKEYASTDINFVTLKLNSPASCFSFNYNLSNIIVKTETGIAEAYSKKENSLEKIYIKGLGEFFYIYSNEDFAEKSFSDSCISLDESNYTLGLFRNYNIFSFDKLKNLAENYYLDYENLSRGLAAGKDFAFSLKNYEGISILNALRNIPKTSVYARDLPIQIVYNNATFEYAVLNIKTW